MTENNKTISNHFNNYFCTIGSNLAEKVETTSTKPSSFLKRSIRDSIYLDPPRPTEVLNLITSLKDNKAVGHDNLSSYYLKAARYIIASYLTIFINFAFSQGIFPDNCKIARIAPIFKTGAKEETNKYRPIS